MTYVDLDDTAVGGVRRRRLTVRRGFITVLASIVASGLTFASHNYFIHSFMALVKTTERRIEETVAMRYLHSRGLTSIQPLVLNRYHHQQPQDASEFLLGRTFVERSSTEVCTRFRPEKNDNQHKDLYYFQSNPGPEGFIYVKVPKSASTTLSAVNIRLSRRVGQRVYGSSNMYDNTNSTTAAATNTSSYCSSFQNHMVGAGHYYGNRNPLKSFLWGSVRDPASRAISRVFFQNSRGRQTVTEEMVLQYLQGAYNPQSGAITKGKGGFQLQYLTLQDKVRPIPDWYFFDPTEPTTVQEPRRLRAMVQRVLDDYDFLAVSERMDESLVTLQFLLNLTLGDILVSSSKVAGSFTYNAKNGTCAPLQRSYWSPTVTAHVTSDVWYAINYGDYLLYHAANRSLDQTIDAIGQNRFHQALQQYREAQRLVEAECHNKTFHQCSFDGQVQADKALEDCYAEDSGCGYRCIDELVQKMNW